MLGSKWRVVFLSLSLLFVSQDPGQALGLQIAAGGQTVQVEDNGKFDTAPEAGTLRYQGQVGDLEIRLSLSEVSTPAQQYALTLGGLTSSNGPEPVITNAGEPGPVTITIQSSGSSELGPGTSTTLRYQGQITDVEDGRLALAVPENRLSASIGGRPAGEISLAAVQSEGEESTFEQTTKPVPLGEAKGLSATLRVNLGSGDALTIDEARISVTAVQENFNYASLAGIGAAVLVILAGFFFLRPRRRARR